MGICSSVAPITLDQKLAEVKLGSNFSFAGVATVAKVVDVYDGDTITVSWYGNHDQLIQYKVRLLGFDCPEMKPSLSSATRDAEKAAAVRAKLALISKIDSKLIFMECGEFDKYGRVLATIYTWNGKEKVENLNEWMIAQGHGIPYQGKKKIQYSEWASHAV